MPVSMNQDSWPAVWLNRATGLWPLGMQKKIGSGVWRFGFMWHSGFGTAPVLVILHPQYDQEKIRVKIASRARSPNAHVGGCQNYGPFLDPNYSTAFNI